jgi:hypothetical protein
LDSEGNIISIENRKNEIKETVFVTPTSPQYRRFNYADDYEFKCTNKKRQSQFNPAFLL